MAGNPLVQQGTLNRLRASLVYANDPNLNVTAPYMAREMLTMAFENDAGILIPTATGGVTSPEPYQMCTITFHILKTQALASTYKGRFETNTNVGDFTVIPDAATLSNYQIHNGVLLGVDSLTMDGGQPGFAVRVKGIYYTNSDLFNLT